MPTDHQPASPSNLADLRVAVVGAGAMGGVFGSRLTEAGVKTTLFDADPLLVEILNAQGLRIREGGGERTVAVHATGNVQEIAEQDALLFCVKCYQTAAAADAVRQVAGNGTAVVSLQNGWGNADVLAERFGNEQLVVGVTYTSATVVERGLISCSGPGPTVLGPLVRSAGLDRAAPLAAALEAGGFPVERPEDVLPELWKKLVLNAATLPTAALTGLAAGQLRSLPEMSALVDTAGAEAVEVGRAQGFDLDLEERLEVIHSVLERAGSGKASMLQDVETGRRTEIDVISGAVVRAADKHGLAVPVTRALHAVVAGLERARGQR